MMAEKRSKHSAALTRENLLATMDMPIPVPHNKIPRENLPEETIWFLQRWEGTWMIFSIILILAHFFIPYFGLLSQPSKMDPKRLKIMSIWILFAHMINLFWIVLPTFSPDGLKFGWIEIGFIILAFGIVLVVFNLAARNKNLVPVGDPKLQRGIDFRL